MGLDVFVFEYLMIPDTIKTQEELEAFCKAHDGGWTMYGEHHKNLPKKYIKKIPMELCDFEATFRQRGLNYEDYEEVCEAVGRYFDFKKKSTALTDQESTRIMLESIAGDDTDGPDLNDTNRIRINNDEIVPKTELVEVWAYGKELGYQRKGANAQFYNDGKWDDNTIVSTKKMLLEDWRKYFSDKNDTYYGANAKQHFKENIIDNFIPGKTFVAYW